MLRKAIILFIIPLYLLGSCGLLVYLHHCHCSDGTTASIFVKDVCCNHHKHNSDDHNHDCCSVEKSNEECNIKDEKSNCCKTEALFFKITDEQDIVKYSFSASIEIIALYFLQKIIFKEEKLNLFFARNFDDIVIFLKSSDYLNFIRQLKIAC